MALGPRLDLRQSQSLVMTPQLQQAIKLLALSNLEVETFIGEALAANPLLDEPFAGIDPISIADIRELVRELKKRDIGVLITDHNVRETLDIVDRACIIYDGQVLFAGTPEALVADQEVRRLYLGESFAL